MNISQLPLSSLTFEARYPPAYHLWDSAGRIWTRASERWPRLASAESEPNSTKFLLDNRVELSVQLERSHVIMAGGRHDLDEFGNYCSFLFGQVTSILKVTTLTRVGVRAIFMKRYPDTMSAVSDFESTGILRTISGKHFGIEGRIDLPEAIMRYEDDNLGCRLHFFVRRRKISINIPILGEEDLKPIEDERVELIFDCDYYTNSDLSAGQLDAEEWVKQAVHVIRRDAKVVLGG